MAAAPSIGRASAVESPPPAPEADLTRDLYERYSGQIFGYCLHKLGSREEAEDAVQNTFLNAFRGLRRGVVPQAESAWLFKIAENVCLSRHRSAFRRGRVEMPSDLQAIQDVLPSPERRQDDLIGLEEALARMPESQRRAILLREWQGLSYREIAEEMDLSQAAVETLIFRARRTLAQGLEDEPKTRRWKRLRQGADVGSILALLKTIFTTGATVKAVATAVAVGSAVVAASSHELSQHHRVSHLKPAASAPVASSPSASRRASLVPLGAKTTRARSVAEKTTPAAVSPSPGSTIGSIQAIPGEGATGTTVASPTEETTPTAPTPTTTATPQPQGPTDTTQPVPAIVTTQVTPTPVTTPGFQVVPNQVFPDPSASDSTTPAPIAGKAITPAPVDSTPIPVNPVTTPVSPTPGDPSQQPKPVVAAVQTVVSTDGPVGGDS